MAKAPQKQNPISHQPAEVGTRSELTPYDEPAKSHGGSSMNSKKQAPLVRGLATQVGRRLDLMTLGSALPE